MFLCDVVASVLGMIQDLGTNFWICLFWVGVLFLHLCFLSGVLKSLNAVCCPFFWPVQLLLSSQGMPADAGSWVAGMGWDKEHWKKRSL